MGRKTLAWSPALESVHLSHQTICVEKQYGRPYHLILMDDIVCWLCARNKVKVYIHACCLKRGNCLLFWRVGTLVRLSSPQTGICNLSFVTTCRLITKREEGELLAFLVRANSGLVVSPQTGVSNWSLVITSLPYRQHHVCRSFTWSR